MQTAAGAHHWRLQLLEFLPTECVASGDIVTLGDGGRRAARCCRRCRTIWSIDRCYIHGDAALGQKRGIALNSASTTITNSYIADIKAIGAGHAGDCRVERSRSLHDREQLSRSGGRELHSRRIRSGDSAGSSPQDVVFRRNHLAKPAGVAVGEAGRSRTCSS